MIRLCQFRADEWNIALGAKTASVSPERRSATALIEGPSDFYQQIVESAHEGVWIHDLEGQTTYANAQMADLLRYPIAEMRAVSLFDVLDEQGQQQALQMLERERQGPLTEQVDCLYFRKDRSSVWCLVSRSPLLDGNGHHIGSINLVSDITERKRVDEELRRTGDLLAEAQRAAHLGSWDWDLVNDKLTWSDEMYRIRGIQRSSVELNYQTYISGVHPDDQAMVERMVGQCVAGVEPGFSYECRIVRPGGHVVWIHALGAVTRDATGALRSLRGTVLDVTAYKRAEEKVQRTSARYRLLQRMATEANEDTGFEHVLQLAVREILGHTGWPLGRAYLTSGQPPQLVPTPLIVVPGDRPDVDHRRDVPLTALPGRVLDSGRPVWMVPVEYAARAAETPVEQLGFKAGFGFPVSVAGQVVAVLEFLSERAAAPDEELLQTCAEVGTQLARVVERQRAADDLAAARDAAMESLRVKSEFLATMSHEIRTPMNGVIGLTNLLLDTELDDRQRQFAEGVQTSGEALLTVINDILDFSKLEAGRVELDYEDFDVRRIVEEVALLLGPAAYAKGLELLAYCLPDVPAVLVGDSGRIRQIVLNLVSNGVKFAATGEVVTKVTAEALDQGGVSLRFEVRDTGIGIPEESRERLFESFSQADASTTRRYGGTGLGLAISQRLVEAMGGTIGFDSELGVGSTFWFEIPLTLGTDLPGHTMAVRPDLLTDLRVLVVDDNATNRMILKSQLGSWQLRPDVVDSAAAALVQMRAMAAQGEPYAIAVLDMCMPDVDGLELAQQVSADESLAGTRMIMLTSTSEIPSDSLTSAGIGEWLLKPVRSSDLYDRLHRLMAPPIRTVTLARNDPSDRVVRGPSMGRVLVVEDNPLNQLVAQGIVTTLGYAVDIVDNGAEALRAILHTSYAAVLMDCHMPVLDGYEATREIRRREGGGLRMPIIAMTAGAMEEDRQRCALAGMDDFVSKPVALAAVQAALAHWTQPNGAAPDLPAPDPVEVGTAVETSEPVWEAEPPLDLNRIAQLRQLGSMAGTDLLGRVVALFARDGLSGLAAIRESVAAGSLDALHGALHKLKGTSSNMGANRVAALCRQLEERTQQDTAALTGEHLHLLEIELDRANKAICRAV